MTHCYGASNQEALRRFLSSFPALQSAHCYAYRARNNALSPSLVRLMSVISVLINIGMGITVFDP